MTQARRAELEARCQAFLADNEPTPAQLLEFVQQIEREVWLKAAKINDDLMLEHDVGSPGISVLAVAANRCHQQREGR
jgi:hypothetical protein